MGSCEDELMSHMIRIHEYPESDHQDKIHCKDCWKSLSTKCELMNQRKKSHPNLIKPCKIFLEGKCYFDNICWYSHQKTRPILVEEFKCRFCEKTFKRKEEFMIHRKIEHENYKKYHGLVLP